MSVAMQCRRRQLETVESALDRILAAWGDDPLAMYDTPGVPIVEAVPLPDDTLANDLEFNLADLYFGMRIWCDRLRDQVQALELTTVRPGPGRGD